ncbi:MAG: sulfotransferase [Cyanobacteria bacterium J06598_1]
MKKKVLFIMGTAHCGSTLLTLILGGHPSCMSIGELSTLPDLYRRGKPVCSVCQGKCSFWDDRFTAKDYQLLCGGLSEQRLHKHIPLRLEKAVRGVLKNDQVFNPYSLIASKLDEAVIVDSTKTVYWLEKKLAAREFQQGLVEPYLLHLIRDGRAVMASYSRRKVYHGLSAEEFGQQFGTMWQKRVNNEYRFFDSFANTLGKRYPSHQQRLRYETLATEPEETTRSLCDWLGIPFERNMLDYRNHENHVIAGNDRTRASVAKHKSTVQAQTQTQAQAQAVEAANAKPKPIQEFGIKLNQRWKTILSPEQIAAFYQATDDMNKAYEWES